MLLDLEVLNLSFNSLRGGDGAKALKDLPSLEEVNLSHNLLGGNLGQLGKSQSLRRVDLCTYSICCLILSYTLICCVFYANSDSWIFYTHFC